MSFSRKIKINYFLYVDFYFFQHKCSVPGCDYRCKRTRMKNHYIYEHKMTEEEAGKKVPPKLTVANMKKLVCSICTRECIPSMLRRHLFRYDFT